MKNKDKKVPKSVDSDYIVSSSAEAVLYGILFSLIGLIGLLNKGVVGSFITYWVVYLFGAFYILFFLYLIFIGIYLIIKKRFHKIRIDVKILGLLLMLIAFAIGASLKEDLTFNNFFNYFSSNMESISASRFKIESLNNVPLVGGGLIGHALCGLLNNCITSKGTKIVIIFLLVVGFLLVFNGFIKSMFVKFNNFRKKRKALRADAYKKEFETKKAEVEKLAVYKDSEVKIDNDVNEQNNIDAIERIERLPSEEFIKENENQNTEVIIQSNNNKIKYFDQSNNDETTFVNKNNKFFDDDIEEENIVQKETKSIKKTYIYPPLELLSDKNSGDYTTLNTNVAVDYINRINELFTDFKIGAQVVSYTIGPSVTRFDVRTNPGVKLSSLSSVQNELAAKLGGNKTVRIELIVEGKDTAGIEVGNKFISSVSFKDVMKEVNLSQDKLTFPVGKEISGKVITASIADMPHLLVSGATGSGKSVFVHNLLISLLMRNSPEELRLILVDPKTVEFSKYRDMPHLLCPIITNADKANEALKKLVEEMERRYYIFANFGNGASKYSEYMAYAKNNPKLEKFPIILVVIDELADLMMTCAKEVESSIQRLGQMARACGIHLVLATQRPSVQFVTGNIKSNIPSRVAFSVSSSIDSRVILDDVGAETLLGKGDLLARFPNSKSLQRAQSAYISNEEINTICDFIKKHGELNYNPLFMNLDKQEDSTSEKNKNEVLYEKIKAYVIENKCASASIIQTVFEIGSSRATYFMERLEKEGILTKIGGKRIFVGEKHEN